MHIGLEIAIPLPHRIGKSRQGVFGCIAIAATMRESQNALVAEKGMGSFWAHFRLRLISHLQRK
jgi:hypothetical protein